MTDKPLSTRDSNNSSILPGDASDTLVSVLSSLEQFNQPAALEAMDWLSPTNSSDCDNPTLTSRDCCFFKLEEIRHDSDFPRREGMENVISAFAGSEYHFVYLLSGHNDGITIYLGVARNCKKELDRVRTAYTYGKVLQDAFHGNFQGSVLTKLGKKDLENQVIAPLETMKRGSLITGIPSLNDKQEDGEVDFQGIDRLINSMLGKKWHFMLVCEPLASEAIQETRKNIYKFYNLLHSSATLSVQHAENKGESQTKTTGSNKSRSKSKGTNSSESESYDGSSSSKGRNQNATESRGTSDSNASGSSSGYTNSATKELINKEYSELLEYLDKELLERLRLGQSKGMFRTAAYALAENREDHERLTQAVKAIFQGDTSKFSPLRVNNFPDKFEDNDSRTRLLCKFQTWETELAINKVVPQLMGHSCENGKLALSTMLMTKELSLLAGLPLHEVPGLPIVEGVDFGLNPVGTSCQVNCSTNGGDNSCEPDRKVINLGKILHRGQPLQGSGICLDREDFCKHIFVAGVTGSGKTTTCQKLLCDADMPFLVIEPAKTEYRSMLNTVDGLKIFTLGNERLMPFRFNPFELLPGESITSHVDMLKAAFTAAFPMEAAMPYLLEDAIYRIYQWYGWDTSGVKPEAHANRFCADPWNAGGRYWPTMTDLLKALGEVVAGEGFDTRLEKDYQASLVSRLKNLTIGAKGRMLNCRLSIDFRELLDSKVIFEMDDLKDSQDKALMMGFVLARMSEAIKSRYFQAAAQGETFRHLTLIEEAHRLLEKAEPGHDDSKKHAVNAFSDMLAEVRKYGEGLIIVDQIPSKLAPDVLKNTNTKIIHKLFARDDREAVGDTMGLDEDQKEWLSRLKTGEAIIFSGNWIKSVHAKIEPLPGLEGENILTLTEQLRDQGEKWMVARQHLYFPVLAIAGKSFDSVLKLWEYAGALDDLLAVCMGIVKDGIAKDVPFIKALTEAVENNNLEKRYGIIRDDSQDVSRCLALELRLRAYPLDENLSDYESDITVMEDFLTCLFSRKEGLLKTFTSDRHNLRALRIVLVQLK